MRPAPVHTTTPKTINTKHSYETKNATKSTIDPKPSTIASKLLRIQRSEENVLKTRFGARMYFRDRNEPRKLIYWVSNPENVSIGCKINIPGLELQRLG